MSAPRPYTLIAELTYRCALKCPYCSNPTALRDHRDEMSTEQWLRVLTEAEELGVMQVHFTGGEPLARKDLEPIVRRARELGLYSNLVTSTVPLTRERLVGLKEAGIDHVQVSMQSTRPERADDIAGYEGHAHKLTAARWVKELELPLTINVVLHRANLDEVEDIVALAEELGADRVELANTQYHAWALLNRDTLLPTREQLERASVVAAKAKARLRGKMDVLFVKPDYFSTKPKACMDGWARRFVHMTPGGFVLPCHAAMQITGLSFDSARDRALGDIWENSPALRAYRGDAWMPEPCRSCERKEVDFGGCRCQAFALTGDASATDPVCSLSPQHHLIRDARTTAAPKRYLYRG
ncbi:pyrroloquinoline quinone biosynthesis protein PqqE [Pendulispora rubella]|uniref:PqqA peptide cyclase n=1 Tax=Pendulispora rubella TaxID=2741070 RepID=A0ABZ2L6B4_9BACT